jgi:hypothetical protein
VPIPLFESAFFYTKPHAAVRFKKLWRLYLPLPAIRVSSGVTIRYTISKGGTSMEEKTININEKVIGDTLYIIESAISSTAKETAYDKLKRMILNDTKSLETKAS